MASVDGWKIYTYICVCVCVCGIHSHIFFLYQFIHFLYPSMIWILYPYHWILRLFPCLGCCKRLEMNMRVWISSRVSRLAESLGRSIFNFSRTLYSVFHSDFTNLHCHQENTSVSFSPCPHQHTAILIGVKWQLFVGLICIYLIISDVDHIFMYLLMICLLLQPNVYKWVFQINIKFPKSKRLTQNIIGTIFSF